MILHPIYKIRMKDKEKISDNYYRDIALNILPKTININEKRDIIFSWKTKDYYFYKSYKWYELNYKINDIKIISKVKHNNKHISLNKINEKEYHIVSNGEYKITKKDLIPLGLEELLKYKRENLIEFFIMKTPITKIEKFLKEKYLEKRKEKNVNYVITFDRIIVKRNGLNLVKKFFESNGIEEQIREWRELEIVDKSFNKKEVFKGIFSGGLNEKYKHLPIDTKYFNENIKYEILSLFNNLDDELDGWLIKSENFQALNTILPKFKEKVQIIYIDPPYNTGNSDFLYNDKYHQSSWLTMMENRLNLVKELMMENSIIFSSINDKELWYLKILNDKYFSYLSTLSWERSISQETLGQKKSVLSNILEYVLIYSKGIYKKRFNNLIVSIPKQFFYDILKKSGYNYVLQIDLQSSRNWDLFEEDNNAKFYKFNMQFNYLNIQSLSLDDLIKAAKERKIFTLNRPQKGYTTLSKFIKKAKVNELIKVEYITRDKKKCFILFGVVNLKRQIKGDEL